MKCSEPLENNQSQHYDTPPQGDDRYFWLPFKQTTPLIEEVSQQYNSQTYNKYQAYLNTKKREEPDAIDSLPLDLELPRVDTTGFSMSVDRNVFCSPSYSEAEEEEEAEEAEEAEEKDNQHTPCADDIFDDDLLFVLDDIESLIPYDTGDSLTGDSLSADDLDPLPVQKDLSFFA